MISWELAFIDLPRPRPLMICASVVIKEKCVVICEASKATALLVQGARAHFLIWLR